jgi:hypothetical protein
MFYLLAYAAGIVTAVLSPKVYAYATGLVARAKAAYQGDDAE